MAKLASAQGPANRFGRGQNAASVIFVRNSQPVILNNTIRSNTVGIADTAAISINANSLNYQLHTDLGRSTGYADALGGFEDNHGPLIVGNRLDNNDINGLVVRGETLTTESVWDDQTITHVLFNQIVVDDFHTYGGLRLQSSADASLVAPDSFQCAGTGWVKSIGPISRRRPLFNRRYLPGYLPDFAQTGTVRKSASRPFERCRFEQNRANILGDIGD